MKILHYENSSEKLRFFRKFSALKILQYENSPHEILHILNSSESYTLEPDMGYQILIQGIRSWYRVSAPDTKYQHEILHFLENFLKSEEM